jgi:spore maturation protein CgeB
MSTNQLDIVILGLSITSSWGNGHATTFRALVRELVARGHRVLFLERDVPWYAENRDLPNPPWGETRLYRNVQQLQRRFPDQVRDADLVIVGSYVRDGVEVGEWVNRTALGTTAFYDIDTPVTMAKLRRGDNEYLNPELIARYKLYLSFTGGPTLRNLERHYGSPMAREFYCSVDPALYHSENARIRWDLGYLGTYSLDRQGPLERLLIEPARRRKQSRFVVAGPQYPQEILWADNIQRVEHLPPAEHRSFYNRQRFTLNITRADMIRAGYSPSVRLFEAAACGTPVISDYWKGLECFFEPDEEILIARKSADVLRYLTDLSESERRAIGRRAASRVLAQHTARHRAEQLEDYVQEARGLARRGAKRLARNQLQKMRSEP